MKYLIINGSPRRENTWKIVERIKDNIFDVDKDAEFDEVDLILEDIPQCIGCFSCFMNGEDTCPHADKIQPISEKMLDSDGLIMTSPVYALNITGLLKTLIDHLAYYYHRPAFFNKHAMVVTTTAGAGASKVGDYMDETLRNFGYNTRRKLCFINRYDHQGYLPLKTKEKIDKETKEFCKEVMNKKLHQPSMKALFNYNVWRAMAYSGNIPKDQEYWKKNNMMNTPYYPKIPCNPLKKVIFNVYYKVMQNMIKGSK